MHEYVDYLIFLTLLRMWFFLERKLRIFFVTSIFLHTVIFSKFMKIIPEERNLVKVHCMYVVIYVLSKTTDRNLSRARPVRVAKCCFYHHFFIQDSWPSDSSLTRGTPLLYPVSTCELDPELSSARECTICMSFVFLIFTYFLYCLFSV